VDRAGGAAPIVLATLNARWSHASLGLRCLRANLGPLRALSQIAEYTVARPADAIVADLLARAPRLVGFGVYIWNVAQTTRVVERLKAAAPQIAVVVGGPEVSHEVDGQRICALADYVITGWGELTFARLARQILHGPRPLMKVHAGEQPPLADLALPYGEFSDADLRQRYVYVEASRGCPFRCEFCLSALDRTAWPFPLQPLLDHLRDLYRRGARQFRFVDRTFNLKVDTSSSILALFLDLIRQRPDDPPFVHFEVIPDHLPPRLRAALARFPPGTLQLEVGIQTWSEQVQRLVSRRQDNAAAEENLRWLRANTHAHLHVDLIAGLPGEDLESFGRGFDRLVRLAPQEIQVGILKRLRGAPIARHIQRYGLRFSPEPPYQVQATDCIDAAALQRIGRFARYWDLVANSGRFPRTLPLLLGEAPFARFLAFSDWLHRQLGATHGIALERLFDAVHAWLAGEAGGAAAHAALVHDYVASGARGRVSFAGTRARPAAPRCGPGRTPERQRRHLVA
jgi:radical SAM superfamily enzyme YgiQ (UPF0313 family)